MRYRLVQKPDPLTGRTVQIRVGLDDRVAVPRRHRVALSRLGSVAAENRMAERRAARAWNQQHHRVLWPPFLRGEE